MAVLYWVHLPEHTDMFKQGYVGVTSDLHRRFMQHKNKFKIIANRLIVKVLLIADKSYCYLIEQKLRPSRCIGWNKSSGGYRNNIMSGKDNPNFGLHGESAPNFKGLWVTPLGKFATSNEAAAAHNLQQSAIIRKCKGRYANNKFYAPKNGWAFEPKERVKP
jgi:hypothetical protein